MRVQLYGGPLDGTEYSVMDEATAMQIPDPDRPGKQVIVPLHWVRGKVQARWDERRQA